MNETFLPADDEAGSGVVTAPAPRHAADEPAPPRHAAQERTAAPESAGRPAADRPRPRRRNRYRAVLVACDAGAAALPLALSLASRWPAGSGIHVDANLLFAAALPAAWVALVAAGHGYERRVVGVGAQELDLIFRAFVRLAAWTALFVFATHAPISRFCVAWALALTLVADLLARYGARKWLHAARARDRYMTPALVIGDPRSIRSFAAQVRRDRYAGMQVIGACPLPQERGDDDSAVLGDSGIPVYGEPDSIIEAVRRSGAQTVVVLAGHVSPEKLRWISWQLEDQDVDLVVAPGLVEVGGRRLHIQPVAGLPLLYVDQPRFTGFRCVLKWSFDRIVAGLLLLVAALPMLIIAAIIRLTSRGPVLFRQVRVGTNGETFRLYKFRSMVVDAEQRLADLQHLNVNGDGVLFKMKRDPRVTRVGAVLRKYSLDELPQLFNVIGGSMSLVGPRPPLPAEVAQYQSDVHRRLLVKPGITGLWQVSGRSDLSWEESERLDLHYVENWSLGTDLLIIWKTAFAVLRSSGAY